MGPDAQGDLSERATTGWEYSVDIVVSANRAAAQMGCNRVVLNDQCHTGVVKADNQATAQTRTGTIQLGQPATGFQMGQKQRVGIVDDAQLAQALGFTDLEAGGLRERLRVLGQFMEYVAEQRPSFDLTSSLTFGAVKGSKLFRKLDLSIDDGNTTISLAADAEAILHVQEDDFIYLIFDNIVESHVTDDEDDDESNLAKYAAETLGQMYGKFATEKAKH